MVECIGNAGLLQRRMTRAFRADAANRVVDLAGYDVHGQVIYMC